MRKCIFLILITLLPGIYSLTASANSAQVVLNNELRTSAKQCDKILATVGVWMNAKIGSRTDWMSLKNRNVTVTLKGGNPKEIFYGRVVGTWGGSTFPAMWRLSVRTPNGLRRVAREQIKSIKIMTASNDENLNERFLANTFKIRLTTNAASDENVRRIIGPVSNTTKVLIVERGFNDYVITFRRIEDTVFQNTNSSDIEGDVDENGRRFEYIIRTTEGMSRGGHTIRIKSRSSREAILSIRINCGPEEELATLVRTL